MNNNDKQLSDETLNSLIDNEFPAAERADLLAQLQTDENAKHKACQTNYLKDMVKTAYSDVPMPESRPHSAFDYRSSRFAVAASVLFSLLLGLIFAVSHFGIHKPVQQRLVLLDPEGKGGKTGQAITDQLRVVFHVSNSTRLNAAELLDDIEGLLQQSIQNHQQVRVEVVAHAQGLDLLREKLSTEKRRIADMSRQYPQLTFVACLNTMERLKKEKGIQVKLIPDAVLTPSGVAHVVKRQQQGWIYIQV